MLNFLKKNKSKKIENDTQVKSDLITAKEAASFLGVTVNCLYMWRRCNNGLPYIRIGRSIRYRISQLEEWLKQNEQTEKVD